MDHDQPLQNINDDILLPQAYVLNGYSRSLLRNPFHASNQKKKVNASKYESVDTSEDIFELNNSHKNKILRNRQISSHRDGSDINAQKVYKVTQDFLEENGLAERSHQPIVDLEKLLAESDQEKNEIVKEISMDYFTVRFEENPDILHERFMKQVGHILHRDPSRPNTSDSGTLYRPQTASSKRSITPSLSGNNPIRPKIPNKEDNESVYKSSPSRPHTGSTVQNDTKEPKKKIQKQTEIDKAKIAVDFLQNSPLLASHRFKGPKSLADWKMEKKTQDQIWDSKSFSVQDFIRDYVKLRDLGNQKMISLAPAKVSPKRESAIDKSVKVIPQLQQAKRFSEIPNKFRRMSTFASKNIKGSLISAGNVETPKFTDQHPEYGNILQKIPLDRSSEEKSILFKVFRDFKAFKKLSDFTLGEVVGALVLQEYESHRAIFKQGDFGTAWYIILSGNVSVQVSKTGRIEDSREVVKLHAG